MKKVIFLVFLNYLTFLSAQESRYQEIIDPRIELVSIVYRLAGVAEYTQEDYPKHTFDRYVKSIEDHFGKYKKHPAVQFAKKLKKRGVGYNYVMYLPLIITKPPNMKITVPLTKEKATNRWEANSAMKFLELLNQFYVDTEFKRFYKNNTSLYERIALRFSEMTSKIDYAWFVEFYGYESEIDFKAINALGTGPFNYNIDVEYSNGQKSSFAILGASKMDNEGLPIYNQHYFNVLLHEFNHSFSNPIILENEKEFEGVGTVLFKHFKKNDIQENIAYGNWQSMLCEYLVRAAVINYLKVHKYDNALIVSQINLEKSRGFPWVQELSEKLDYFSANREKYKDLFDFIPELLAFFELKVQD
jgi:hypothetical protein